MRFLSALLLVTTGFSSGLPVFAGGSPESGREASQTTVFSSKPQSAVPAGAPLDSAFVYRQAGYLATVGPVPLRFGPPSPGCNERTPPRVATTTRKPSSNQQAAATAPAEVTPSAFVPTSITAGGEPRGNVSEEAINFYRPQELDPEVQKRRMRFMFDPVQGFQMAPPPTSTVPAAPAPQSRATLRTTN